MTGSAQANLVSVVIPVYNGERYLAEAIESVLAQTHPAHEVIVVDDGSTDASARVAGSFGSPVRYASQPRAGAAAARNRGTGLAESEFLAFLDADDLWTEGKLELQLAAFASDPAPDAVFGHVEHFHSPELDAATKGLTYCPPGTAPAYLAPAMLIRRSAFERVGPFETWRVGEFLNWFIRANEVGLRTMMLPDLVLRRRLHEANMGVKQRGSYTEYARVLKAALDRRRAAGEAP